MYHPITPFDGKGGYSIFAEWYVDPVTPLLLDKSVFSIADGGINSALENEPDNGMHYPRHSNRITTITNFLAMEHILNCLTPTLAAELEDKTNNSPAPPSRPSVLVDHTIGLDEDPIATALLRGMLREIQRNPQGSSNAAASHPRSRPADPPTDIIAPTPANLHAVTIQENPTIGEILDNIGLYALKPCDQDYEASQQDPNSDPPTEESRTAPPITTRSGFPCPPNLPAFNHSSAASSTLIASLRAASSAYWHT
eukprot:gene23804-9367_t